MVSRSASGPWCRRLDLISYVAFPNVRVRVTGNLLDSSEVQQYAVEYADFMGSRWAVGDGIWNYTNATVEQDNNGKAAYGSEMHVFMTLALMATMPEIEGGVKNPLILADSCPPGIYNDVQKNIRQAFMRGQTDQKDGEWTIQLSTQNKPKTFKFETVRVFAEGVPAFAAFCYDLNGNEVPEAEELLGGTCQIIDLGYVTADSYTIRNGNLNPDQIKHASDFNGGIRSMIVQPAINELVDKTGATHLTEAMVDSWLKQWYAKKPADRPNWIVPISGKKIRLDAIFGPLTNAYAQWVVEHKVIPALHTGAEALMPIGGGWHFALPFVRAGLRAYPSVRLVLPELFPHLTGVSLTHLVYFFVALAAVEGR